MAILSAIFRGNDELSDKLNGIADRMERMVDQFDSAGSSASAAFEKAAEGADNTVKAADLAASSIDHWTESIGHYDKSALEAVYSTEDLVEMGYKTEEALAAQATAAETVATAMEKGTSAMEEFRATISEQESELNALQEAYNGIVLTTGKYSADAIALKGEINELTEALEENQRELESLGDQEEKTGDEGDEMANKIGDALTGAALAATIKEVTEAVIDMTNAFSDAESVIVKATGATGDELNSLSNTMMEVYAGIDDADMNNTAGAIGEINTRLGLQGDELKHVTDLFMIYADNTNSSVVPAIQSVTKVMKNWDVDVANTEGLLDKLTYASQTSGASVDSLSDMVVSNKAVLQQMGYSLDESISLMAMFEYEGLNASSIMMGFRSAITNFSSEGKDASIAMQEVIEQIASMGSESEATALAIDTFGSRAGAELAFAIRNSKFEIDNWVTAIEGSQGTLAKTDEAADTLSDKWTMAGNSMNAAFTGAISPAVDGISSVLAELTQGIGDYLRDHPILTKAITALGIGLLAVAGKIVIAKVAALASIPSFAALGTAISAAVGPIGLAVGIVAALTAGLILLCSGLDSTESEFDTLTAASKQQYRQLEKLNDEYERTIELEGETSEAARNLAAEIAVLETAYESSKMTIEEWESSFEAAIDAHNKTITAYEDACTEIDTEEANISSLITKLLALTAETDHTTAEQEAIYAIISKLNAAIPEMGLAYDSATGRINLSADALHDYAAAMIAARRYDADLEAYIALVEQEEGLYNNLTTSQDNAAAAQERYNKARSAYDAADPVYMPANINKELDEANAELNYWNEQVATAKGAYDENIGLQEDLAESIGAYSDGLSDASEITEGFTGKMADARAASEELAAAYTEAYDAAYSSITGQYELWDKADSITATSVSSMNANIDSQISHWQSYNTSVENLLGRNIDGLDEMVASFADGSAESVNAIAGMANASDADLEKMVAKWQALQEQQETTAGNVADLTTGFSEGMAAIKDQLAEDIKGMDMSEDAKIAALSTLQGYIDGAVDMLPAVRAAYGNVASAASAALRGTSTGATVSGYASGTRSAEPGVKLVGEDGPELINFQGGEVVYNADETSRIFGGNSSFNVAPTSDVETSSGSNDKKITIEIAGRGGIEVGGKADEGTILDILVANVKPALLSIIRSEVFEEGDESYEF